MKYFLGCLIIFSSIWHIQADENAKLKVLYEDEWQHRLSQNPILARNSGASDVAVGLPRITDKSLQKNATYYQSLLSKLKAIHYPSLDSNGKVNYRIFRDQVQARVSEYQFGMYQKPFNSDSGFYSAFARVQSSFRFDSVKDYEDYLAVLEDWPQRVDDQIYQMQVGLDRGFSQPKVILAGLADRTRSYVSDSPERSLFFRPFLRFPEHIKGKQRETLFKAGTNTINKAINPAYSKLADFFENTYIPNARTSIAATELPNGAAYYQDQIRHYTTLDLSADEIHQIGLEEVSRIRAEMNAIIESTGFDGSFAEFLTFLRTDPQFYAQTAFELLAKASRIAKKADAKMPMFFKHLPRTPYGVEPVPAELAPNYTTGRYVRAPRGSKQPGYYWVNTYALDKRPLYELEALTLHEAVPGHHLQIALSQELGELPNFRQNSYISAFGEGWGLYAEWLGLEMGFYTDPYSDFGRLTYEMWRAVRLVVDTGMHAKGWSREKAQNYLADNTALSLHNVRTEIDRYISWPAQALSYKLGELTIKRLRKTAETELGSAFDIRDFHYVVLNQGAVPLSILEEQVADYISEKKSEQ